MATKKGNFIRGIVGPLIFRKLNGKQVVSSRIPAGTMKQTEATKQAAGNFGAASGLSKHFRLMNQSLIAGHNDSGMFNRLTSRFVESLNKSRDREDKGFKFSTDSFDSLTGFDFNINSPVADRMSLLPGLILEDSQLRLFYLETPEEIDLKFPVKSMDCEIIASMAVFNLKKGQRVFTSDLQQRVVKKKNPVINDLEFRFNAPQGCLCIVSILLKYYSVMDIRGTLVNTKQFSPAAICGAIVTPGTFKNTDNRNWLVMDKVKLCRR